MKIYNNKENFEVYNGFKYIVSPSGNEIYIEMGYDINFGLNIIIPSLINGMNVVKINDNAFIFQPIYSVIIPNSITEIGNNAFSGSTISSVTIYNSSKLNKIGQSAFFNTNISEINIPESVTLIDYNALMSCKNLKNIYFQGDMPKINIFNNTFILVEATGYHKKLPKWNTYRNTSNKIGLLTLEFMAESTTTSTSTSISLSSFPLPIIISGVVVIILLILLKIFVI